MPRYSFYCFNCERNYNITCPMGQENKCCIICGNEEIKRVFNNFLTLENNEESVVQKERIKINKQKLKKMKNKLKSVNYEDINND